MSTEHVPSHNELINQYEGERRYYEVKFKQAVGVVIVLSVTFLLVKIFSIGTVPGN